MNIVYLQPILLSTTVLRMAFISALSLSRRICPHFYNLDLAAFTFLSRQRTVDGLDLLHHVHVTSRRLSPV